MGGGGVIPAWVATSRRRIVAVAAVLAGCGGALAGGPVAAVAASAYGGLAVRGVLRRRAGQAAVRERRRRLDNLCLLAADLRAGLPVPAAVAAAADGRDRIAGLTMAAARLAEQTGAPLADLVERIETDARAMDRG